MLDPTLKISETALTGIWRVRPCAHAHAQEHEMSAHALDHEEPPKDGAACLALH